MVVNSFIKKNILFFFFLKEYTREKEIENEFDAQKFELLYRVRSLKEKYNNTKIKN